MAIDEGTIRKYGKVLARVDRGSTDGEKSAARVIAQRMESENPGLRVAFLAYAAREAVRDEVQQKVRPSRQAVETLPVDSPLQRFLRRAAEWGVDKLEELLMDATERAANAALTGGPMTPETIDWAEGELLDHLEDHCVLESDLIEDDDEEEPIIRVELELPASLAEYILSDPENAATFAQWALGDDD